MMKKRLIFWGKYIIVIILMKICNIFLAEQEWISYPAVMLGPIIGLLLYDIFNYALHCYKKNKKLDD